MSKKEEIEAIFVRHSQSVDNMDGMRRGRGSPLTVLGVVQSTQVAAELERLKVRGLITSSETRAIASSTPAAGRLGLVPEISELLNELRRPSITVGFHSAHPAVRHAMEMVRIGTAIDSGLRIFDEETQSEFFDRGGRIFAMLEAHPIRRNAIFSHAHMLRGLHTLANTRFNPTNEKFQMDYDTLPLENGAICRFTYKRGHNSNGWWWHCTSWNETGHLR